MSTHDLLLARTKVGALPCTKGEACPFRLTGTACSVQTLSHVVLIKAKLRNMEAIRAACKRLGFILKENQKTYKWFGRWMDDYNETDAAHKQGVNVNDYGKCEHAISVPNCNYEAGLIKSADEDGYSLIFDFFDNDLKQKFGGQEAGLFIQAYATELAIAEGKANGYLVQETAAADGTIKLTLTEGY